MLKGFLKENKILLYNLGNHEYFSPLQTLSILYLLKEDYELNISSNCGWLTIILQNFEERAEERRNLLNGESDPYSLPPGPKWHFLIIHNPKYKQHILEKLYPFADVVVTGHTHQLPSIKAAIYPAVSKNAQFVLKPKYFIQSGTLKEPEATYIVNESDKVYIPAVVITRKALYPFVDYREAIKFAKRINQGIEE